MKTIQFSPCKRFTFHPSQWVISLLQEDLNGVVSITPSSSSPSTSSQSSSWPTATPWWPSPSGGTRTLLMQRLGSCIEVSWKTSRFSFVLSLMTLRVKFAKLYHNWPYSFRGLSVITTIPRFTPERWSRGRNRCWNPNERSFFAVNFPVLTCLIAAGEDVDGGGDILHPLLLPPAHSLGRRTCFLEVYPFPS